MRNLILILLLTYSCNNSGQENLSKKSLNNSDTILKSETIPYEISDWSKKSKRYFDVINNHKSEYFCEIYQISSNNKVVMSVNDTYHNDKKFTYKKRIDFLKRVLATASKEYNLDSLRNIDIGTLADNEELAINVSKQYKLKFGNLKRIESYQNISEFLKESQVGKDVNELLKPYGILVEEIYPEKIQFIAIDEFLKNKNVNLNKVDRPENILDCMMAIRLSKKNNYP